MRAASRWRRRPALAARRSEHAPSLAVATAAQPMQAHDRTLPARPLAHPAARPAAPARPSAASMAPAATIASSRPSPQADRPALSSRRPQRPARRPLLSVRSPSPPSQLQSEAQSPTSPPPKATVRSPSCRRRWRWRPQPRRTPCRGHGTARRP